MRIFRKSTRVIVFSVCFIALITVVFIAPGKAKAAWGVNGMVTYNSGGLNTDGAYAITKDFSNNIYVAGYLGINGNDWAIRKYTSTGALDTAWGSSGMVIYNSGGTKDDVATAITIDSANNIYVAGYQGIVGGNYEWAIRKYTSTGALDTSWGSSGMVTYHWGVSAYVDKAYAVTIDSANNIYVAGHVVQWLSEGGSGGPDWAIRKYTSTGALDTAWGSGGTVIYNSGGAQGDYVSAITIDSSRNIYVAGYQATNNYDWAIRKYTSTGALDTAWGSSGMVTYNSGPMLTDIARAITIDSSNNIYVAGEQGTNGIDWAIRKYTSTGALATTWGSSGMVTYDYSGFMNRAFAIVRDSFNNIYVAGSSYTSVNNNHDWAVRKYTATGALAATWGANGMVTYNSGVMLTDIAFAATIDSSNNIYVAGYHQGVSGADWAVLRIPPFPLAEADIKANNTDSLTINAGLTALIEWCGSDAHTCANASSCKVGTMLGGNNISTAVLGSYTTPALTANTTYYLECANGDGSTTYDNVPITVISITPPTASFTFTPFPGANSTTAYNVDASSSSDPETPLADLQVRWDWENDGVWDTGWSTVKTASKTYTTPTITGVKTIKMEVKDTGGLIDSIIRTVTVILFSPPRAYDVVRVIPQNTAITVFLGGQVISDGVLQIEGDDRHSISLKMDGTVWTWGLNAGGELGDGTTSTRSTPVQVKGPGGVGFLSNILEVAVGLGYSLALKADGTVWAWGANFTGQLGDGSTNAKSTPVQVKGPAGVGFLNNIIEIAGGAGHSLALKADGTVWEWGNNVLTPVQVKGPAGVGFLSDIIKIAGGAGHSLALKADGTVWAWGNNNYGQLGDGTVSPKPNPVQVKGLAGVGFLNNIIEIASGAYHSLALKADGTVWAWGWNEYGQLGDGTSGLGNKRTTPAPVKSSSGFGNLTNITGIAGGYWHSLATQFSTYAFAWGRNNYGQLGDNTTLMRTRPVNVFYEPGGLSNAIKVGTNIDSGHSLALKVTGEVFAWGLASRTGNYENPNCLPAGSGRCVRPVPTTFPMPRFLLSLPANGSLKDAANNPITSVPYSLGATFPGVDLNVIYTPNLDYIGPDSFQFVVNDGIQDSAPGTVSIMVNAIYNLSITKSGTGSGSVSSFPAGINCGADCSESYTSGTAVSLTPTPAAGSTFAGWSGDADCSDGSVTMNASKSCTAIFNLITYTLSITKSGTGAGSVSSAPAGINCGADCSETYISGTSVALTPTPSAGSTFAGWSGDADCSDGSVTMDASKTCNAIFNLITYTLTAANPGATGRIVSGDGFISCGDGATACNHVYNSGASVTLNATPAAGYTYGNWGGDCGAGSDAVACGLTINGDKAVSASFIQTGTIYVNATLDGTAWTGSVNYMITGPEIIDGAAVAATFSNKPIGNYTLDANTVSGGPAGAILYSITPAESLLLGAGSSITFTINFVSPPNLPANLSAPNWSYAQASQLGALKAFLRWQFSDPNPGSSESAYQLIMDDDPDPASPLIDTGKCLGYQNPVADCLIDAGVDSFPPTNGQLNLTYNTKYYWWVKVWNNYDLASGFKQYDTVPDTDNDDGDPLTFTTYKHEFPLVDFSWTPTEPSQGENVRFTDASKYYTGASPNTPTNCNMANCDYLWTVPADATINNASAQNPQITFNSSGQMNVTLTVTDKDDGYYSSLTKTLNLRQSLPSWKEVKPK